MPDATNAFSAALSAAQGEFPPIPKDSTVRIPTRGGATITFKYASLDAILKAVRPALAKHGLAVTSRLEDGVLITSIMGHGSFLSSSLPIEVGNDWKAFGGSLTYARRYTLAGLLGVAADEDTDATVDDEAEGARPPPARQRTADDIGLLKAMDAWHCVDGSFAWTRANEIPVTDHVVLRALLRRWREALRAGATNAFMLEKNSTLLAGLRDDQRAIFENLEGSPNDA